MTPPARLPLFALRLLRRDLASGRLLVMLLAALSVFMAGINIFGGFLVTRRMLAMFQKS